MNTQGNLTSPASILGFRYKTRLDIGIDISVVSDIPSRNSKRCYILSSFSTTELLET